MKGFMSIIHTYPTWSTLVGYYVFSAFVGALPAPPVNSNLFYQFFFKFMNTLGANVSRAYSSKLPSANAQP